MKTLFEQISENLKQLELKQKELYFKRLNIITAKQLGLAQVLPVPALADVCHTCKQCNRVWTDDQLNMKCQNCGSDDIKIELIDADHKEAA